MVFPTVSVLPSFSSRLAVELTALLSTSQPSGVPGSAERPATVSWVSPPTPTRDTVILFCVSVPVLSEQMTVADPIVSVATSWRTRALARVIFRMARASDTVTLIGSPSGTATTTMMTMYTKYASSAFTLPSSTGPAASSAPGQRTSPTYNPRARSATKMATAAM